MSDLISRQDALDAVNDCGICIQRILDIPSAEPERKTGKWIYDTERVAGDGWTYSQYHCSECGFQVIGGLAKFCPNCGADMRGEE